MEYLVMIIMLCVILSFSLKLSFHSFAGCGALALLIAIFTALSCDFAVTQSKTQIADWIADSQLMLDIAVLLTIDVALQLSFCFLHTRYIAGEKLTKSLNILRIFCFWFPGILLFPVLFLILTQVIFSMPGTDFNTLSWLTAAIVLLTTIALAFALKWLLPMKGSRLEMNFIINLIIAALGVIATVNGRTATAGVSNVELLPFLSILALFLAGAVGGIILRKIRPVKRRN